MATPDQIVLDDGTKTDIGLYDDLLSTREGNVESDIAAVRAAVGRGVPVSTALDRLAGRASRAEYLKRFPIV